VTEISIIGGGIAGLTAALALQQQGVGVRVFEQAPEFAEVGAGLTLSQPASRGLFSLGLREAIEANADVPATARIADYATGQPLDTPNVPLQAKHQGDIPYFYQIHRADIHKILAEAVRANDPDAISLDMHFERLVQKGDRVSAVFSDGTEVVSEVLLGADGVNSRVRACLFGEEVARFTGQVAYRFLVPYVDVEQFMRQGPSVHYTGPGRNLVRYLLRGGTLVNGVAFVKTDNWAGEGWSTPAEPGELMAQFAGWNEDVKGLLSSAPVEGTRKWALFDRDPLAHWSVGRATVLGDAAHPMLPFLGLGAAMGIEDAVVFARAWAANPDRELALRVYEETRRERANGVLLASRLQAEIYQSENNGRVSAPRPAIASLMEYDPASTPLAKLDS
jgi:salicylate hydroxylase